MIGKLAKVLKVIDMVSEYAGKAFSFLILAVITIETVEVIKRYIFHSPSDWSWELSTMLSGASFIIGGAWVLKANKHVRTDIIYGRLSPKAKAIFDLILFTCIGFVFAGILTWKTTANAIYSWSIMETTYTMWAPPMYLLKTVIAVSFILLLFQMLAKWIRDLILVIKGDEL